MVPTGPEASKERKENPVGTEPQASRVCLVLRATGENVDPQE